MKSAFLLSFYNILYVFRCEAFLPQVGTNCRIKTPLAMNSRKKYNTNDLYDDSDDERKVYFTRSKSFNSIYKGKTTTQKEYNRDIHDDDMKLVIAAGPAGTGKTLFPTQYAAKLLAETDMKVVFTRPLISVDEEIGYLPGDMNQKMDPWITPIFDILREFYTQKQIRMFIESGRIQIVPLAFMRGRTFKNSFIIGDEMQNTSNRQLLMLLTRLGVNSRLVITGDVNQCDHTENGLMDLLSRINKKYPNDTLQLRENGVSTITLASVDIQRSPIVATILEMYSSD